MLKSQDTLLALKYCSLIHENKNSTVRELSDAIGISAGEVSKSTHRLIHSGLVVERDNIIFPSTNALAEWLCYGVRYAYPYEQVGYGRGMPTAWNCPLVQSDMVPPMPALVWELVGGMTEGTLIKPIHQSVPLAASQDEWLYQALSLVDVIRGGKPRELKIARELLVQLIKGAA